MKTYSKIEELILQGYEFRIPGGKSRSDIYEETYASFGVIPRSYISEGKEVIEILIVPYLKKEFQLPRISFEKKFKEDPEGTLEREVAEETGVLLQEYDLLREIPVADSGKIHDRHTKYAYIASKYDVSNIRKNFSPSQPNLGIPLWISLELLDTLIFPKHKWILKEVKKYLHFFKQKIPTIKKEESLQY